MKQDQEAHREGAGLPQGIPTNDPRAGFTVIEVILAIVILSVGLLGAAGTTLLLVKQTTMADVATERTVAMQGTIENLRSIPFDSVTSGADSIGVFEVSWTVTSIDRRWKGIEIITTGPGLSVGEGFPAIAPSVPDTFSYRIVR